MAGTLGSPVSSSRLMYTHVRRGSRHEGRSSEAIEKNVRVSIAGTPTWAARASRGAANGRSHAPSLRVSFLRVGHMRQYDGLHSEYEDA